MSYQKDRDEFVGVLVAEASAIRLKGNHSADEEAVAFARLILRNAATIQRHAINACNREVSEAETTNSLRAQTRIVDACEPWGISPTFSGDPRGAVVKLLLPSGRYNSMGGAECGYCVPTR